MIYAIGCFVWYSESLLDSQKVSPTVINRNIIVSLFAFHKGIEGFVAQRQYRDQGHYDLLLPTTLLLLF